MENYQVKDIYEASYLYATGQKLLELKDGGRFYWFIFSDKKKCGELAQDYWSGGALVNAKSFSDALRSLKDRIFANK